MAILYRPDCKNDENFKFPMYFDKILKVNGCWPTNGDMGNIRYRLLDRLYTLWFWFAFGCLTFIVGAELRYFLANISDVTKAVENLCTFMIGALAVFRMLHVRYEMQSFKQILRIFCEKIWISEETHPLIYRRCIQHTKPRFYLSLVLCVVLLLYTVRPIALLLTTDQTMESHDKELPYSMVFPYDEQKYWSYIFSYLGAMYAGFITITLYYAKDAVLVMFISFLSGQFEILHGRIMRLIPECHADWLMRYGEAVTSDTIKHSININILQQMYTKRLHDISSHHTELIRFCLKLDKFFSVPLVVNFLAATFQIAFLGFQFLIGGTNSFGDFLRFFLFFCSVTGQLYMMSDLGTMLITRSMDTAHYLFMCNWEGGPISKNSPLLLQHDDMELEMLSIKLPLWQYINYYPTNNDFQHKLRFMIMRSHRPVQLTAMKFASLSLESFSRILSSSLSYFTLLKTMLDKQN